VGSDGTTALDIVTLVVAITGVALALGSLAWQAATFILSGSRARVKLRRGAIQRDALGRIVRVAGPLQPSARDLALMRSQGFTRDLLIVEVRNVGRLAVSVESATAEAEGGWGFAVLQDPENTALPFRLEPGAKESWHVDLAPLQMVADSEGKPKRAWMSVELGTGKVLRTKQTVMLEPSSTAGSGAGG
jgi:hypothetical protein